MNTQHVIAGRHVGIMDAMNLAAQCYAGEYDRCGWPVILHSLRIAMKQETDAGVVAGLLHDLVEDDYCTLQKIKDDFGDEIADVVNLLSRREGESYMTYIKRLTPNRTAAMVKLADIEDNTDVRRIDAKAAERVPMYLKAYDHICDHWKIERKLTIARK